MTARYPPGLPHCSFIYGSMDINTGDMDGQCLHTLWYTNH